MPLKTWKMNRLSRGHNGVLTKIYRVLFKITLPIVCIFMVGMAVKLNNEKKNNNLVNITAILQAI